jgi:hypothetical protein
MISDLQTSKLNKKQPARFNFQNCFIDNPSLQDSTGKNYLDLAWVRRRN